MSTNSLERFIHNYRPNIPALSVPTQNRLNVDLELVLLALCSQLCEIKKERAMKNAATGFLCRGRQRQLTTERVFIEE